MSCVVSLAITWLCFPQNLTRTKIDFWSGKNKEKLRMASNVNQLKSRSHLRTQDHCQFPCPLCRKHQVWNHFQIQALTFFALPLNSWMRKKIKVKKQYIQLTRIAELIRRNGFHIPLLDSNPVGVMLELCIHTRTRTRTHARTCARTHTHTPHACKNDIVTKFKTRRTNSSIFLCLYDDTTKVSYLTSDVLETLHF